MKKNDDTHYIPIILDRESCNKHGVPRGIPCYHIHLSGGGIAPGVCGKRVKRAGFNSQISPQSLTRGKFR